MNEETKAFVIQKTKEMMAVPYCYPGAIEAAKSWLNALGTDAEAAETVRYIAELKADLVPIDDLLAFASSAEAIEHFGADQAQGMLAHAQALKASGVKFCDCEACAPVEAILSKLT